MRNDFALSGARTDNFMMIERVQQMGLPTPWQYKTNSLPEAIDDLERLGGSFPLVVKPPRCYGTEGVTVCNSYDQYREAVRSALVRTNKYSEGNRKSLWAIARSATADRMRALDSI